MSAWDFKRNIFFAFLLQRKNLLVAGLFNAVSVSVKRVEVVVRSYGNTLPLHLQSRSSIMVVNENSNRKKKNEER